MAATSKTPSCTGDLFHGARGVYERQKWPPCERMPKLPQGEMLEKYDFFFLFSFFTLSRGEVERKQSRIRQKLKKLGGCIKSEERWTAEQRMANYFSPLVSPEGFPGSEVQPSWSAEDCIKLNLQSCFTQ